MDAESPSSEPGARPASFAGVRVSYPILCAVLGFALAWVPAFIHGPIPYKFDVVRLHGTVAVWAFYSARLLIGVLVGITHRPARWYVRGPLCGLIALFPVGLVAVATPGCGFR
jgi:hypothetical protein